MAKTYRFHQLDVFTDTPLLGNALAVVHNADGLDADTMQAFARWTNLSETTFLMQPRDAAADYYVRIFTPEGELPFAGHPTLGSCHAWLTAGGKEKADLIVQECGVGLVKIRKQGTQLAFTAPPRRRTGSLDGETIAQVVSCLQIQPKDILHHQWVDNGPGWCAVMLESAAKVLSLKPDFAGLKLALGVVGPQPKGSDTDFEVRAFVPSLGVPEDPVTGSLNAGIAQWLMEKGLAPNKFVVSQGTMLHRQGRVFLDRAGNDTWVGGNVVICVDGSVTF